MKYFKTKVRGVCAYYWLHAFTSDLAEISRSQISTWPPKADRINAVLPLGEDIELAKVRNEKEKQFG